MFFVIAALSIVFLAVTATLYGRDVAIRCSLPLALLLPPWMLRHLGTASIDMRVVAFLAAAGIFLSQKGGLKLRLHLMFADALVLLLTATVAFSLFRAGQGTVTTAVSITIQWLFPYLFGRLLGRSTREVEQLVPLFVLVLILLTAWAAFESILKVNPLNAVLNRAGSFNSEFNHRWGLRRAEGPLTHPISFGMLLLLLLPWALEAARRARAGKMPSWLMALPVLAAVGILFPISRGPILGLVCTFLAVAFLRFPRISLPTAGVVVVLLMAVGSSGLIPMLEASAQEQASEPLSVNGVEYQYTGTTHRLLLFPVFREALITAGWFGFGNFDMGLPEYAKYVEPHLRTLFKSVDNCYLFLALKHGYMALLLFVALGLTVIVYAARLWRRDPKNLLAAGMLGGMASVMVVLLTVWFNYDFGFLYLLNAGLLAGWFSDTKRIGAEAASAPVPVPTAEPVAKSEKRTFGKRGRARVMDERSVPRSESLPRAASGEPFDLGQVLRRRWRYLALAAVVSVPLAVAVAHVFQTNLWVFRGTLAFVPYRLGNTSYSPPDLSSLATIIGSRPFAHRLVESRDMRITADEVESGMVARLMRGKPHVEVTFQSPDREISKQTLEDVLDAAVEESHALRDEEIDNLIAEYRHGLRLSEGEVAKAAQELEDFHSQNGVFDVEEGLQRLRKEEPTMRFELFVADAKREGLLTQQREKLEALGGQGLDASEMAKLQMLEREIQDEKQKESARLELAKKRQDFEREYKLAEQGVITRADLDETEFELKLLELKLDETEHIRDLRDELNALISKLIEQTSSEGDETSRELKSNAIVKKSFQTRLDENLHHQERLMALVPKEKELKDRVLREKDRRRNIERQIEGIERLKASSGWQFTVIKEATPADPHVRSNKKKLLVGAYGLFAIALASPCLFWEIRRHRRALKTSSPSLADQLGLVPLADVDLSSYETVHPAMINGCLPDENSRQVAHVLRDVVAGKQYTLAMISLQPGSPPLSWVLGIAKCFSRWKLRVLVLEVGSPTGALATPATKAIFKPRPRTTRTRSQVARSSAISIKTKYRGTVDPAAGGSLASAKQAASSQDPLTKSASNPIEQDRRSFRSIAPNVDYQSVSQYEEVFDVVQRRGGDYCLVLAIAGIDAQAALNAETLALECDGVVFCEIEAGKEEPSVVEVVRNIVRCNGNVLGVVRRPGPQGEQA